MQFLLLLYENEKRWASGGYPAAEMSEYREFGQKFATAIKGGNALQATGTAATVRVRDGKQMATDGPFAETKEQLGGYYLIEAKDRDEAVAIAAKLPSARFGRRSTTDHDFFKVMLKNEERRKSTHFGVPRNSFMTVSILQDPQRRYRRGDLNQRSLSPRRKRRKIMNASTLQETAPVGKLSSADVEQGRLYLQMARDYAIGAIRGYRTRSGPSNRPRTVGRSRRTSSIWPLCRS